MPPRKKKWRERLRPPPPGPDPRGMETMLSSHIESMLLKNFSEDTVRSRIYELGYFVRWCADRGLTRPAEVTKPMLERYQRYLFHYRKRDGKPLGASTQHDRLAAVRAFFKYLARTNQVLSNPASDLEFPRVPQRLPRGVLSVSEVERVLAEADVSDAIGLRDRAMMETFYSTGMRRRELAYLLASDMDAERGTVLIREGKWRKDRYVPIGERALAWIDKYLLDARPQLAVEPDPGQLFLGVNGEPLGPNYLTNRIGVYVRKALGRKAGCHIFRHTMATLMLEGGADVRFIQEMLGHANLQSTQVYTRVSIRKLKAIHTATHPGARLERKAKDEALAPTADDATREDLLSSLAAEAAEENAVDE